MRLVHRVFGSLKPVTKIMTGADVAFAIFAKKQIVIRKQWRRIRPDISENESGDFLGLVSRVLDAILECAVFRLRRLLQAFAVTVVEPAVITTANPPLFHSAEFQRCTAVGTVQVQKP